ncbi:HAD family hydrolase [Haloarchaeobius baliensis]|uniref:HAD family hydrolase n=1 Tax=Haloarchaeobius baliensis TaxID=1670458 RepID=UPI003F8812B5
MQRAILFDLDGTLLHLSRGYGELLAETFRTVEGECRDEWLETYDEAFFEAFTACEPEPCRSAFATVSDDPDALATKLLELEAEANRVPEGTHEDLAALSDRYQLGVLTNGMPEWQREKLRANDLDSLFDAVITSYEAGAHKPEPAPFEAAESALTADAFGMVGDSDADVDGATRQGWAALRYDGQRFREVPTEFGWE